MIVVIDTNVFVHDTHLLRKKGGPELLQLLRATKGQLLIPEILRVEYIEQTVRAANEERSRVNTAISILETLLEVGVPIDDLVPDGEAAQLRAEKRLRVFEAITLSDPLTTDLHVAAGRRSLEKRRPTSKSDHGYKDCLIWESVLRLPRDSEVRFVSRDNKAFFIDKEDALHSDLVAEARERGITVIGYKSIERVVEELMKANPALDLAKLEAQDLVGQVPELVEEVVPPARTPSPAEATDRDQTPAGDIGAVARRLSAAQKRFDGLDLKVLAYIAYLDAASKADILGALTDAAGIASDVAKNIIERLAMNGFVRDTGNHYLVVDRVIGELLAPTVEEEIITWLERNRRRDGK